MAAGERKTTTTTRRRRRRKRKRNSRGSSGQREMQPLVIHSNIIEAG